MIHTPSSLILRDRVSDLLYRLIEAILLISFFILGTKGIAQSFKHSPMKWGIVSSHEIEMTHCSFDSSAAAVILSDFGEWKIKSSGKGLGYKGILERHTRIKILREEGFEWAEGEINYISEDKFEKITGFRGQTLEWDGQKMVAYPLIQGVNIIEETSDYVTQLKYNFPRVQVGSIIELSYVLTTNDIIRLKPWDFQSEIPTLRSEVRRNNTKEKKIDHVVIMYNIEQSAEKESNKWLLENIPALKVEPYVLNLENYRKRLKFEIKDYKKTFSSRYGSTTVSADLYKTWSDLLNDLTPRLTFFIGNQQTSFDSLNQLVDTLISNTPDTLERLKLIYNYVRDSIEWNDDYSFDVDIGDLRQVFNTKKGSSGEINSLLKEMLAMAGVRCTGMILPTIDHGVPVNYPVRSQFNQYIVLAQIQDKNFFLNATDRMRPYDFPAINDLNMAGFVLQHGVGWMAIPNDYYSTQRLLALLSLDEEGRLKGNVSQQFGGYIAVDFRTLYDEIVDKEEFWEEFPDESLTDTELLHPEIIDASNPDKPLALKYELNSGDFVRKNGDYMYIDPMLDFVNNSNPFVDDERSYPIQMGSLISNNVSVTLMIPQNYEVESIPEPFRISLPEKAMVFYYECVQAGNTIQIVKKFDTSIATFPTESYPALKQIYDRMIAKQKEQIVLKRIVKSGK